MPLSAATGETSSDYYYKEGTFDLICGDGEKKAVNLISPISDSFPYTAENPFVIDIDFDFSSIPYGSEIQIKCFAQDDGTSVFLGYTPSGMFYVYAYDPNGASIVYDSYSSLDIGFLRELQFIYYKLPNVYSFALGDVYICTIKAVFIPVGVGSSPRGYEWTVPLENEPFYARIYADSASVKGHYVAGDLNSILYDEIYAGGLAAGREECGETHQEIIDEAYAEGVADCEETHELIEDEGYNLGLSSGYDLAVRDFKNQIFRPFVWDPARTFSENVQNCLNMYYSDGFASGCESPTGGYGAACSELAGYLVRDGFSDLEVSHGSLSLLYEQAKDIGWTAAVNQGSLTERLIYTALEAPFNVALAGMNFEVFGINLAGLLFSVLGLIIVFFITRTIMSAVRF